MKRTRGAALLVILGVLVVLSTLSLAFLSIAQTERMASRSYLDSVRARLLAESGFHAALEALEINPFSDRLAYWGDDERRLGLEPALCRAPLPWARRPSLMRENEPLVRLLAPDGSHRHVGISGRPGSGTYDAMGDVYQVRIEDLSGRIFVNDGLTVFGGN